MKDYGIIVQLENNQTGFIINDHKLNQKYKQWQSLKCIVLDVDPEKRIVDLSEKAFKNTEKSIKNVHSYKGIVELNKDNYLIVSIKNNRKKFGVCILQNFNQDNEVSQPIIGDEIEVQVVGSTEEGLL